MTIQAPNPQAEERQTQSQDRKGQQEHSSGQQTGRPHRPVLALTFMLAAIIVAPVMDGIVKLRAEEVPVVQLAWARYFFHALMFAPFAMWKFGFKEFLVPPQPLLQYARGGTVMISSYCFIAAIAIIPLADALAIAFSESFIVALFAIIVLREQVGWRRWSAIAVGFVGVLIVLRPGFGMTAGHLWALGAGLCFGFYFSLSRFLTGQAATLMTMGHTAFIGAVGFSILMIWFWYPVESWDMWVSLAAIGILAGLTHMFFQLAFQNAEASYLAVFAYSEIVTATIVGFVMFGDFPDAVTWLGITVIVSAGIYLVYREQVTAKREGKREAKHEAKRS